MKVVALPNPADDNEYFYQVTMTEDEWKYLLTYESSALTSELIHKLTKGGAQL